MRVEALDTSILVSLFYDKCGLLTFNIKDLRRQAVMPVAQFGKAWAVTFRFKPFPVA